jgi:hypothetical protein
VTGRQYVRVLPDDGIIGPVAVHIASSGVRRVHLTEAAVQLAAERILARGGTPSVISTRLHVRGTSARALAVQRERENEREAG